MSRARRIAAVALAAAGLAAAPASALAALDVAVVPSEARYGGTHHAEGRYTDAAGAPLAGRRIALEKRDFPYTGTFRPVAHATTAADGSFSFDDVLLRRNADLRVVAFDGTASGIARAWTYPAFTLRYKPAGTDRITVTQTYTTPKDVRLSAPTLFYLGTASARRSTLKVAAKTRRTAAGRFAATATVKLPKAWKGRFKYASCFGYSKRSGMGDPARGCPRAFDF
jgi:hypothetical protein